MKPKATTRIAATILAASLALPHTAPMASAGWKKIDWGKSFRSSECWKKAFSFSFMTGDKGEC